MSIFILGPDPSGQCCGCETRLNPCDPCSVVSGSGSCYYSIPASGTLQGLPPNGTGVYSGIMSNLSNVVGCLVYLGQHTPYVLNSAVASNNTSGVLTYDVNITNSTVVPVGQVQVTARSFFQVLVADNTQLSLAYNVTQTVPASTSNRNDNDFFVYRSSDSSLIESQSFSDPHQSTSATWTTSSLAGDTYVIAMFSTSAAGNGGSPVGPLTMDYSLNMTANNTFVVDPCVGYYDNLGTGIMLEACPKLLLPLFTEANNAWYPDLSSAQSVITSSTSDCISYFISESDFVDNFSFVASHSLNTIDHTITATFDGSVFDFVFYEYVFSFNSAKDTTLSYHFDTTFPDPSEAFLLDFLIFDSNGQLIFSVQDGPFFCPYSKTLVSSLLPYTGRYTVVFGFFNPFLSSIAPGLTNLSVVGTLTSSDGLMTVNPVQALYDVGLDCPARLDCS